MFFNKAVAFIKRDFFIQISYRSAFIFEWFGILSKIATFYFIAKLFDKGMTIHLTEYQVGYFPFVFVGIAFSEHLSTAIHSFAQRLREEQMLGTLETVLSTPTTTSVIVISLCFWDFIFTSIGTIIYLLFGILFFHLNLSHINLLASLIIFILTLVSFSAIGIISAAFIMVFKKSAPISWLATTFSAFFGGVFFPVDILPQWLQKISYLLPSTHSLIGLRHAILQGYNLKALFPQIAILFIFCIVLLPLALQIFKVMVRRAKVSGTLSHY
jgi:ABC-2 type transport system permease protein